MIFSSHNYLIRNPLLFLNNRCNLARFSTLRSLHTLNESKSHKGTLLSFFNAKSRIQIRHMHRSGPIVRSLTPTFSSSRSMSFFIGGNLKPAASTPPVKDTDLSTKHKTVFGLYCQKKDCTQHNCSDPNSAQHCPLNIQPSTSSPETVVIGNFTSRIPANKPGVVIDPNQNYSGQPKPQEMVVESNPPQVKPSDINVDKKSTAYAQDPKHHNTISNATTAKHSNPLP
jgi:hypothetical protein